jgi:sulfate adenylyltransferase subunit 1
MSHDILKFLTAGNVDDGKSSFLGRLLFDSNAVYEDHIREVETLSKKFNQDFTDLSLLVDGLESEREQKITIDCAYRYFTTDKRKFIIADSPGHEEYTRNMAVAASNSDLAVILLDVTKPLQTQAIRHSYIAYLSGIRHFIVAVNKMDLVSYDEGKFEAMTKEYQRKTAKFLVNSQIHFVPISAKLGGNVVNMSKKMDWYQGRTVLDLLETIDITEDVNFVATRLPIQNVVKDEQDDSNTRYLLGRLVSGNLSIGQTVKIWPSLRTANITQILVAGIESETAKMGNSVAIVLDTETDIARGSVLTDESDHPSYDKELSANLIWFKSEVTNLSDHPEYLMKLNHNLVNARITKVKGAMNLDNLELIETDLAKQNDIIDTTVKIATKLPFDYFANSKHTGSFLLIDKVSNETIACGLIKYVNKSHNKSGFFSKLFKLSKSDSSYDSSGL